MIIIYVLTGVTLLIVVIVMWRIAVAILRRFDGSYEPEHQAPRPWARSAAGAARAGRRATAAARRLPGAVRRRRRRDLGAEDRITLGLMQRMRAEDTGGLTYGAVAVPQTSPAEFPYAAAPLREQEPGTAAAGANPPLVPPPPPELSHDAFRWPQRWHEPVERASLPPVTGPAITALAILTAPVAAHLAAIEQAKAEEWDAYVRETRPWADDTGSFTAICGGA